MRRLRLLLVFLGFVLVACGAAHHSSAPPVTTAGAGSSVTPATVAPAPTTTAPAGPVAIPVIACPTSYGGPGNNLGSSVGSTAVVRHSQGLGAQLAYYTNDTRTLAPVLGPRGWHCEVQVGADGTLGVDLYPGSHPPADAQSGGGEPLIVAGSDAGCQGCVFATICPYVTAAAEQLGYGNQSGFTCPGRPAGETSTFFKGSPGAASFPLADVIGYTDPTAPDPTNGVVLYTKTATAGGGRASEDSCTLSDKSLCTVILDDFIDSNWMMG